MTLEQIFSKTELGAQTSLIAAASDEHEEVLLGLGAVGEVDDESAREAGAHRLRRDHLDLLRVLRVELEHRSTPSALKGKKGKLAILNFAVSLL